MMLRVALTAFLATAGFAQTTSQTFHFTYIQAPQARQEMVNVLRSVGQIRDIAADTSGAVTVNGTEEEIALAKWLVQALDQEPGTQTQSSRAFVTSDPRFPEVRVHYTSNSPTPQALQEIVNTVRSIAEVQMISVFNAGFTVAMRGDSEGIALAEWLVYGLDRPSKASAGMVDYGLPFGMNSEVVRLFYLPPSSSEARMQLMAKVRSEIQMQRFIACNNPRAFAARGTSVQIADATRLILQAKLEQ